jgi:uncharacterized HNH endonuclease L247
MFTNLNNPFTYVRDNAGAKRFPYSTTPYDCTMGIAYVNHPGVQPFMYSVNTEGHIFDISTGIEKNQFMANEYLAVSLKSEDGFTKNYLIHRVVGFAFCKPPTGDLSNYVVNHINGNKFDNRACNLEWLTVAANNQHAIYFLNQNENDDQTRYSRPTVDAEFVHMLCKMFCEGKSNTQIMKELNMEINNANHTLLRDIRGEYTWKDITCQYNFDRSSKKHAYTPEQKEEIKKYIIDGKSDKEIFYIMQGREYVASTDRLIPEYRTIQSTRDYMRKQRR